MRDPVFVGKDVAEAVRLASRTLAVPESTLRYVVLDPGQVGGRGLSATEARIAVLIEKPVRPPGPSLHGTPGWTIVRKAAAAAHAGVAPNPANGARSRST